MGKKPGSKTNEDVRKGLTRAQREELNKIVDELLQSICPYVVLFLSASLPMY